MNKYFAELNEDGSLKAFYNDEINENIPKTAIEISKESWEAYFNCRFIKPIWDGNQWIEGLTQAEIDEIKSRPQPLSEIEQLRLENAQANAELFETMLMLVGGGV